ncbi:site-specific DNA-methyltransferase [Tenacibaculum finnmarkense]|uniref:site-specific DNA-methyltransferase n=1 Tax=Tenacibaculum finnmarkense TaxID=2781243 RepID=UPI00187B6BED|nr:site-specific DNA-methyltransferase [Tenacibaculum finnmarkense]MBE7691423.1 site-specific DNA-methyltransferase [Tenacibaculum finnmarkense genomovar finnmarkense]MCG8795247.1 site-specific DNA-methyltransferase [Tenacibaculum finnmarkense]MCG8797574.1 site-specific DNA-methyltransferase [Tenacibaculum finnmarkense]
MNKKEILQKIKSLDSLNTDEKAYLVNLVNTTKKYGLVWEEKTEDVEEQLRTKLPILKEVKERAIINDTETEKHPNHILIEGDNLHALTTLTFTHENKIDLIYIDPPYNTGNKDFIYNDKIVDKDDSYRHSKWLSFMAKRLKIAHKLLADDGLIFISIDDNEDSALKLLCDEIFNEDNFLGRLVWFKKRKGSFLANYIVSMTEYILPYRKSKNLTQLYGEEPNKNETQPLIKRTNSINILKFPANLIKTKLADGIYEEGLYGKGSSSSKVLNNFKVQNGIIISELNINAPFIWSQDFLNNELKNGTEIHINTKNIQPRALRINSNSVKAFSSFIDGREFSATNEDAYENLKDIFKTDRPFQYSKPKELIKKLIRSKSFFNNKLTIMDFMAGSGTTLHSLMEINKEDNKKITGILVTNNENQIAEKVTYERNKRVIEGYTDSKDKIVAGLKNNNLRYYKCDYAERKPSLKNKKELTYLATELLCIKENCYKEVTSSLLKASWHKLFTNSNNSYVYVIYDDFYIEEAIEALTRFIENTKDITIKVYVFSNGQYAYAEEFENIAATITLAALPDAIYKAYQNVLPKEEKEIIPTLDEDVNLETVS